MKRVLLLLAVLAFLASPAAAYDWTTTQAYK